jgi:hypothetical protein
MADKEMHHIMLHQRGMWLYFVPTILFLGGLLWIFNGNLTDIDEPPPPPFVVDLRSEEFPSTLDYTSRYQIVVRVEKPDGVEVRLYDEDDGELIGTFIEQPAAEKSETRVEP